MIERLPVSSPPAGASRALLWACAALSGLVALAWVIDASLTSHMAGHSTWAVAALAAGICWAGAMISLVLLHVLRLRGSPMAGAMLGMLVRMTIPLVIIAVAASQGGTLAKAGLAGQLVVFYLITLVIETCLSVVLLKARPQSVSPQQPAQEGSASHG